MTTTHLPIAPAAQQGARRRSASVIEASHDIACLQVLIANVIFVGDPADGSAGWVLVDAGMPYSAGRIVAAAEARFGRGARPRAIILTHGHFDHVGALK